MQHTMQTYKLSDVIKPARYMHILIDGEVETDADGNFIIDIGYTRVSTDKQADEGYGLEIQDNILRDYCERNKIKNLVVFSDDGYTGTKMERPALQGIVKMISDYNNRKSKIRIGTMITPKIDCLGRIMFGIL